MKARGWVVYMVAVTLVAQGRIMRTWSYQELTDKADAVVIAKPLSTKDTEEKSVLPDISPNLPVVGLETELEVRVVLKGEKSLKKITLHHYRLANASQPLINGPMLISFDPQQYTRFLLFLHRDADGRYSPVSGQTDPAAFAVLKLEGSAQ